MCSINNKISSHLKSLKFIYPYHLYCNNSKAEYDKKRKSHFSRHNEYYSFFYLCPVTNHDSMRIKKISLVFILCFTFALLLVFSNYSNAQTEWTYFSEEPILAMDPLVSWGAYGQPTVLIHNDTIKMWYAVAETTPTDPVVRGRIHYAWSLDGYTWNKHPNNPVLDVGEPEQWDAEWLDTPGILWDGTEFKLYYYADSLYYAGHQDNTAIGLATSPDGINWTRQGKVLEMGAPDEWDGHHIELPALYYDSEIGLYAMLYTGSDRSNYPLTGFIKIGLAISFDGYEWTKWPTNPVMDVGIPPAFNDIGVAGPAIVETDGIFEMWYSGIQAFAPEISSYDSLKVGYAVSLNGTSWIQYPGNPVMQATPGDSTVFWAFGVVWDDSDELYKMYFESHHWQYEEPTQPGVFNSINAIFYATAPRTVLYSPECNTSISENVTIEVEESTQLEAQGGDFYQWDPTDGLSETNIANPIASPDETITYTVLIVSDNCITKEQVTVTVEDHSEITTNTNNPGMVLFPNPAISNTKVFSNHSFDNATIIITDVFGKIVYSGILNQGNKIIDGIKLNRGIYDITICDKDNIYNSKLVII